MVFLIPAVLCAGLIFSQENVEKNSPDRWYWAAEFSITETAPVNISIKAGLDKIYAALYLSYNQFESDLPNRLFYGTGFGSIFPVDRIFFFNSEIILTRGAGRDSQTSLSFVHYFGFKLPQDLEILLGPSISWAGGENKPPPFLKIFEYKINERHALSLNGRVALRLLW
jgi:hypothetical protein